MIIRRSEDHDFPSESGGKVVPFGIYDQLANLASVFVGKSGDTGEFAADSIEWWWREEGQQRYPDACELVILADCGGANGPTNRLWKWALSERLVQRHGLEITVAHYPPGASKWNSIEHRVISQVQRNWAGQPLESYQKVLKYLRTTTTATGLKVSAYLLEGLYKTGIRVNDKQMAALTITRPDTLSRWNYTLTPTTA